MLNYKVRLENLEDSMWVRKVYIMTFSNDMAYNDERDVYTMQKVILLKGWGKLREITG